MKMTVAQAFEEFLQEHRVYCAEKTIKVYQEQCGYFFRYLETTYQQPISALVFLDLPQDDNVYSGFILSLRSRETLSNTSIRSYCRSVRVFLRYCYDHDLCRDYMKKVKLPRDDAAPKLPLRPDEVQLLDLCFDHSTEQGLRNYCIIHLMLDCGMRSQEVRHLQISEIDMQHNLIRIRKTKGAKSRYTLIPDFLIQAIREYLFICQRHNGYVFVRLRGSGALTEETIKNLFYKLKSQTGIFRIHAHLLRHTFAVSYLVGGGNLEFLRVFLGHYDYSVTQHYLDMAAEIKMLGSPVYQLDPIFFTRGY